MSIETPNSGPVKKPWHLWVVAVLSILWYFSATFNLLMVQFGKVPSMPEEIAYYAAQPLWFIVTIDVAYGAAAIAAVALLLKARVACWLFAVSLATMLITGIYDLAMGTSRALVGPGAMAVTAIVFVIAILVLYYAWRMSRRVG